MDALMMEGLIRGCPDGTRTFFSNEDFSWIREVESHWSAISVELDRLMRAIDLLPGFEEIQIEQKELSNDKRWKIFPLFVHGTWLNTDRCPSAVRALKCIPGLKVGMFSILQAGKELPAHRGVYAGVLRYHMGIKVPNPEMCGIRVGNDIAHWREGTSLVFDDSHEHAAWNRSDNDRIVLFVDFLRPLPLALRRHNERIVDEISSNDFIIKAVDEWINWEKSMGQPSIVKSI